MLSSFWADTARGQALSFQGQDAYVQLPSRRMTTPYSICGWANFLNFNLNRYDCLFVYAFIV